MMDFAERQRLLSMGDDVIMHLQHLIRISDDSDDELKQLIEMVMFLSEMQYRIFFGLTENVAKTY